MKVKTMLAGVAVGVLLMVGGASGQSLMDQLQTPVDSQPNCTGAQCQKVLELPVQDQDVQMWWQETKMGPIQARHVMVKDGTRWFSMNRIWSSGRQMGQSNGMWPQSFPVPQWMQDPTVPMPEVK